MKRHATAVWSGSGKDGKGNLTTQSPVLNHAKYAFNSRFEDEPGTNPEELIAAAHAGCFTMKLSFVLSDAGFVPDSLETTSFINFEGGKITGSHIELKAKVKGISQDAFDAAVKDAELNCPVSQALRIPITSEATLNK